MKSVACGRYIIKQKLGAGSFGEIHRGEDKETGQSVAIKLEPVKTHVPQLSYESKLYNIFKNGVNIPKFYWFGTESSHNSMVIELLGKSLEDSAALFPHHRLSLKTVLMLADQMLSAVQYIHLMNFIHRDIKPDNFVMGIGKNSNKVFVIDFGLSKKYRDPHTHQHIKYTERKDLTGTARYASLAALKGIEQSRRDDLEALGFVWLYLLRGDLPWMGLDAHNRRQKYDRICQVKEETSFESLCSGFPDEFVRYFYNVRSLRFVEEPDYSHFRKMFRKLFIRLGYIYDYQYDWTVTTSHRQHSSHEVYNTLNNTTHDKPKEHKQKADFLSDREKRPNMLLNLPNQEKSKQKSKSRRGINEIQNTLDTVNVNMSTAPQLSQKKGEYAKDTNDQNRVKNIKKSKRIGKSEADAYPRMQIPRPKNDLSDSTSSDDQLQLSQLTKRVMKSTNANASNLNSVSRRTMISKTPNRNSQNYGRLDRSELELFRMKAHPLSPIPTSTPNLPNMLKHAKNTSNIIDDSSYSNKNENETQNNNIEIQTNTQQNLKKEVNKNIKNTNNNDEYYSSESYSYEDEIETRLQNRLKKQNTETNLSSNVENENDDENDNNNKNGKRQNKQHQDTPIRVNSNPNLKNSKSPNTDSYKQKSKSPGRSDGYTSGANKKKVQQSKSHNNNINYNSVDDEAVLQTRTQQRQKRSDAVQEQNQNENVTTENIDKNANKKKKRTNSSSSDERLNKFDEFLSPNSAPIPTPSIPTLAVNNNNNSEETNINKDSTNESRQNHNKPERQRIPNTYSNNNNKNKLKRTNSSTIKQKTSILDSSSSQDGPQFPPSNTNQSNNNNPKQRNPQQSKKHNQNENNSNNSMNSYYSNSSFNFEKRKDPISKTPQRSTVHYATTNSAANPQLKQEMRNSNRAQNAETPDRQHNTRISYQAQHHTDVVRDKRLPMTELSPSITSSSSYNDNDNETGGNRNKIRSGHHQHSDRNQRKEKTNERDREHSRSKEKSSNLRAGGETDVGVIQQRMKMPKPDRDIRELRRERDRERDRNDDDDAFESMNLSARNPGRRSEALAQSRTPNLRAIPRPGAKKKLLTSKDRRNSLRPSAMIPNWMNEKFKGRK